jgi:hypothetical protein
MVIQPFSMNASTKQSETGDSAENGKMLSLAPVCNSSLEN